MKKSKKDEMIGIHYPSAKAALSMQKYEGKKLNKQQQGYNEAIDHIIACLTLGYNKVNKSNIQGQD